MSNGDGGNFAAGSPVDGLGLWASGGAPPEAGYTGVIPDPASLPGTTNLVLQDAGQASYPYGGDVGAVTPAGPVTPQDQAGTGNVAANNQVRVEGIGYVPAAQAAGGPPSPAGVPPVGPTSGVPTTGPWDSLLAGLGSSLGNVGTAFGNAWAASIRAKTAQPSGGLSGLFGRLFSGGSLLPLLLLAGGAFFLLRERRAA